MTTLPAGLLVRGDVVCVDGEARVVEGTIVRKGTRPLVMWLCFDDGECEPVLAVDRFELLRRAPFPPRWSYERPPLVPPPLLR